MPDDPQARCFKCVAEGVACKNNPRNLRKLGELQTRTEYIEGSSKSPDSFREAKPPRVPITLAQSGLADQSEPLESAMGIRNMKQGAFLIKAEQIATLPPFLHVERSRFAQAVQKLWDILSVQSPQDKWKRAREGLAELSKKLRSDVRKYHENILSKDLSRLDFDKLADHHKKRGGNWDAIFNPGILRALDINQICSFYPGSAATSVTLSTDGRFIAIYAGSGIKVYACPNKEF